MVQISPAASSLLYNNLTKASVPQDAGYRLALLRGDYRLRLDRPTDDDRVVHHETQVVFMVEKELDQRLEGVILDVNEEDKERLVLDLV